MKKARWRPPAGLCVGAPQAALRRFTFRRTAFAGRARDWDRGRLLPAVLARFSGCSFGRRFVVNDVFAA
jgi:hypothetical protein